MTNTSARSTVTALRDIFSRHGLPEIIVSDNGPQFTAAEFQQFCTSGEILHRTSAPYRPSTNGQAERVVQILKSAIRQALITNADVTAVIVNYLLVYRTTPHSTTGEPPSMLLMGRRLRSRLDLLTPFENYVRTMLRRTAHRGFRHFNVGDPVLAPNYGKGGKWVRGVVSEVIGSRHYIVNVSGNLWKRHVDQLLRRCEEVVPTNDFPVDPPGEIAADPTFPVAPVPFAAVPEEPPLTGEDFDLGKRSLTESEPATEIAVTTQPEMPMPAHVDDTHLVPPSFSNESCASTVKRYPTRSTRRLPSYLQDCKC